MTAVFSAEYAPGRGEKDCESPVNPGVPEKSTHGSVIVLILC